MSDDNHPDDTIVEAVTWQSPNGGRITVSIEAERILQAAGMWPKDNLGAEYCSVYHGASPMRAYNVSIDAAKAERMVKGLYAFCERGVRYEEACEQCRNFAEEIDNWTHLCRACYGGPRPKTAPVPPGGWAALQALTGLFGEEKG